MKICVCTTPIRPYPTTFPPFGSMAIIQSLRKIGEDVSFLNIDYFRYNHIEIEAYFKKNQFNIVGISAVVSTAYAYTKYLSNLIRSVSPDTVIIVGGNLAASSEILLRKCDVDICVVGDGELVVQALVPVLYEKPLNYDLLRATKGICFLDEQGTFVFTGYGAKPSAEEIEWPDYGILEADGSLPYFITDKLSSFFHSKVGVARPGKSMASIVMAKGCVARCTFCHRWEKGYRVRPADQIADHVRYLKSHCNVGYLLVSDENFGADRKAAWEIADRLGELDVTWMVCGVRTRTVDKESLQHWKNNGCVSVIFGIESGSDKILKIMEKNAAIEDNINALKWTSEVGLETVIQLVLGMPGEDDETIQETIEFLERALKPREGNIPSEAISINYAQALPGTPLYEYGRQHGLIGNSIDEEEKYLINISDTDAYKEDHFVNNTSLPLLKVLIWRPLILAHIDAYYLRKHNEIEIKFSLVQIAIYYIRVLGSKLAKRVKSRLSSGDAAEVRPASSGENSELLNESGYFNIHHLKFTPLLFNSTTKRNLHFLLAVATTLRMSNKPRLALRMLFEYVRWKLRGGTPAPSMPERSLRKIVTIMPSTSNQNDSDMMIELRKGR